MTGIGRPRRTGIGSLGRMRIGRAGIGSLRTGIASSALEALGRSIGSVRRTSIN